MCSLNTNVAARMAKVGIYRDFDRMRSGTQTENGRCPLNVNVNVNSRFIQHIIAKPLMSRVREKKSFQVAMKTVKGT